MDPYEPPKTAVSDPPQPPPRGSILKGVLIGGAVDVVGSALAGMAVGAAYALVHAAPGMGAEDVKALAESYTREAGSLDTAWGWGGVVLGTAASLLGGYFCARFAREKWQQGVVILGLAMAAFGLYMGRDYLALGPNLSISMVTFAAVCAGGWLYARGGAIPAEGPGAH